MASVVSLDDEATQAGLAELVGVSRQAIQKNASKVGLQMGGTYREWLLIYCEHMRTEAAGRANDNDKSLAEQRLRESEQKTLQLAIANNKELDNLVLSIDVGGAINRVFSDVSTELTNAGIKIQERLESELSIKIDDELIFGPIGDSAKSIAEAARQFGEDFSSGVGDIGAEIAGVYG
ncbi:hypothetical protein HBA55_34910 [Pseudomaricurvus alkylphenolicus]|uniref:hypothetical protein n=1 Tax=Pseudomaricurvus alkylphenolicus TaxID=1306991 RepID=UPI00141E40B0|nr:hypothetical protein [Pseudomaricurvus alkylphenolicus]NIB44824.1 hypothetical protein [Pseudomaricurvus alkylphenolicus]